jgi:hypothetical protein
LSIPADGWAFVPEEDAGALAAVGFGSTIGLCPVR